VIEHLSNADAFLAVNDAFPELSPVGEHPSQMGADELGRKSGEAEPFPDQTTFKQLQDFQEKILGPSIVPGPEASRTEVENCPSPGAAHSPPTRQ
jgi:hypothetical protein